MLIDLRTKKGMYWSTGSSSIHHIIMTTNFGTRTYLDLCKNNEINGLRNYILEQGRIRPTWTYNDCAQRRDNLKILLGAISYSHPFSRIVSQDHNKALGSESGMLDSEDWKMSELRPEGTKLIMLTSQGKVR